MPSSIAAAETITRRRPGAAADLLRAARTIRGRILVAFLAISVITAALGCYGTQRLRAAGDLTGRTFDQSLMSVSYARAAAADFWAMEAATIRRSVSTAGETDRLDARIATLHQSLVDDLSIAGERSQSEPALQSARRAKEAVEDWYLAQGAETRARMGAHDAWRLVEEKAVSVDKEIDLLINYTAGDGFRFRQQARTIADGDIRASIVGTGMALLISGILASLLARRIIQPVTAAASVARRIACGELDCDVPQGRGDELGDLLAAMASMQENLRGMMAREVAQRRSAQTRLADALESSREGIVVVDPDGRIALANTPSADVLAVPPQWLLPGRPVTLVAAHLGMAALSGGADEGAPALLTVEERLADGRWLRIGRSPTREGGFVAVLSDITQTKAQEAKLRAINFSLDAALENMSQGLCLYDAQSRLIVVNRRFNQIFGLRPAEVRPGLTFEEVFALKVRAGNYDGRGSAEFDAWREAPGRGLSREPLLEELAHGRTIAVNRRATAEGGWVVTYEDVTERREAEKQVMFMARHDALTRLPNRVLFAERIDRAIAQLGRGPGFAVLCLDLDRFKQVNDTLGHHVGDELLRQVAGRLARCVREADTVARLGGDEFAIVQVGVDRAEDTIALARAIVEAVSQPLDIDHQRLSVGVSIGIALAPGDGTSAVELMKHADAALYRAKADGSTWRCFEAEMDTRLRQRRALELDLQKAIETEAFEVHYQPIYDLRLERVGGFEALLRWHHPERGYVSPAEFIAVAEEIGLVVPLGAWVLRKACAEARTWPAGIKVAVNVSPFQFGNPNLVTTVAEALAASGLPAQRLELEITETVLMASTAATVERLQAIRAMGVRFSLDDFGTGYSSLSYLRSFPVDKLKIDQSFIRDLTTASDSGVIVSAILGLGSNLRMRTTAEGVETAEQVERLRAGGCDEAQGYFFSRPVPAQEVPAVIRRWSRAPDLAAE